MIVDRKIPVLRALHQRWLLLIFATAYSALVVLMQTSGLNWVNIPTAIPAMLGTVLSVLLGFRTAAAYDRWWEARKIWGAIVNDSRTFGRQVLTLVDTHGSEVPTPVQRELVYRQIAWNYALKRSLRQQEPLTDVESLLPAEELRSLQDQRNVPNALLLTQGRRLRTLYEQGALNAYLFTALDNTLGRLTDHMGKCERIKTTLFPVYYSYFVSRAVFVFFLLLPPGLAPHLEWVTIPIALVIEMLFSVVEMAGTALQDPFDNRPSDPPLHAIARTIEINLRQQLGETELPPPVTPENGVLM